MLPDSHVHIAPVPATVLAKAIWMPQDWLNKMLMSEHSCHVCMDCMLSLLLAWAVSSHQRLLGVSGGSCCCIYGVVAEQHRAQMHVCMVGADGGGIDNWSGGADHALA